MPLLLLKLGTNDYADGRKTVYAMIADMKVVEITTAANEDEAVAKTRELADDGIVEVEPALEAVAKRRHVAVRPLTPGEKIAKAHLALSMYEKDMYRGRDGDALIDFLAAAAVFVDAVVLDTRPEWYLGGHVQGTVIDAPIDRELFLLVEPGADEPKLYVLSASDERDAFARDLELASVDHMSVEFRADKHELIDSLDDAYDLQTVPLVAIVEGGKRRPPQNADLELLAPLLLILGRQATEHVSSFTFRPKLGGEVAVKLYEYKET